MDGDMFDAKKTCGLKRCEQWGKNKRLQLCDDCVEKILKDNESFNLLAMDGLTFRRELGYMGVYNKHMNYFVEPHNKKEDLHCNEGSKSSRHPIPKYPQCYSKVAYIDLVAFKAVNSCFGEPMGDAIIAYAANYLKKRFSDHSLMVARKGGDEFNVYYMNKPRCVDLDKLDQGRSINDNFKDYVHKQAFIPFKDQEIVLCVPNDRKPRKIIAVTVKEFRALAKRRKYDKSSYNFGVLLKGMYFHFGVGSNPDNACSDKGAETRDFGKSFKERARGEFAEETCICLLDRETKTPEWIPLYNHLIFTTPDDKVLKTLIAAIGKFAQGNEGVEIVNREYINCDVYGIPETFFSVVRFDPDFIGQSGIKLYDREKLLKDVCKFIRGDIKAAHSNNGIARTFVLSNLSIKKICEQLGES